MNKVKQYISIVYHYLPIKKNVVLFNSFDGQYNDNPKYISEKLYKKYPNVKIVWVQSSKSCEIFPKYVETVKRDSLSYYIYISCAQIIIDNYIGIRGKFAKRNILERLLKNLFSKKRKQQYNISTWHGTPLKRIGLDIPYYQQCVFTTSSDYVVAGCNYTRDILLSASNGILSVKMYGTPRNDLLIYNDINIRKLKKKFNIPLNLKVVLYAPTFRDDVNSSGVNQMKELEFDKILEKFCSKFSSEWCFIFRVHQKVLNKINVEKIINKYKDYKIINGNLGDDMVEYLLCTDVLITDYSGSMFDFALTKRPCFLYAPDREHYEKQERGFYMDYDDLPFPKAYTSEELVENIKNFDEISYKQNVEKFLEDIGNVEDGHAAERIVDDIIYFLETGIKR